MKSDLWRGARVVGLYWAGFLLFTAGSLAVGQSSSASSKTDNRRQISAYRSMFRRTLAFKRIDDSNEALNLQKPSIRHMQATHYMLSESEAAELLTLAEGYQAQVEIVHTQMIATIQSFRSRFPNGKIAPGVDHTPPAELGVLQQQEDALVLHYLGLLQNSMSPTAFAGMNDVLLNSSDAITINTHP